MKRKFKVEALYKDSCIYYAVYQKRFFWGWKFIGKFVWKEAALRAATELLQPPIYFK